LGNVFHEEIILEMFSIEEIFFKLFHTEEILFAMFFHKEMISENVFHGFFCFSFFPRGNKLIVLRGVVWRGKFLSFPRGFFSRGTITLFPWGDSVDCCLLRAKYFSNVHAEKYYSSSESKHSTTEGGNFFQEKQYLASSRNILHRRTTVPRGNRGKILVSHGNIISRRSIYFHWESI
jgi:hypothetical protein